MPLLFSFLYLTQIPLAEERRSRPSYSLCLSNKPWTTSNFLPVISHFGMFLRALGWPDPLGVFSQCIGHIHQFQGKQESQPNLPADAIYNHFLAQMTKQFRLHWHIAHRGCDLQEWAKHKQQRGIKLAVFCFKAIEKIWGIYLKERDVSV